MFDGIHAAGPPQAYQPPVTQKPATETFAAKPEETTAAVQSSASAIYFSPSFQIDREASMAIYVVRDSETGAVVNQYPSKKIVDEYKRSSENKAEVLRQQNNQPIVIKADVEKAEPVAAAPPPAAKETKPQVTETA